ncbi:hypothetical protein GCM10025789_18540 [Tessaracoccus lubricantis]|uniref:Uncharacterized protein n=2 Tax=Tessaracoccus lubricantis TaxID=545543 RepID=A0ABP9FL02_9ACTN|nr:hypothetical protein [Candidatus Nanopelagicales bacterium]
MSLIDVIAVTRVTRRGRYLLAMCAVATGMLLAGCSQVPDVRTVDANGNQWSVGVADPRFSGDDRCDSDSMIEATVMSADLPPSGLGITLRPEATEDDAQRIAECLRNALTSGEITISRPTAG